jgi:pseudouridine kinase
MDVAIAHMDILKNIDIEYIKNNEYIIKNSEYCIVDTNLPEILEYVVTNYNVPFILDAVSVAKAEKVKELIGYFHTIKPNKHEAEVLAGMEIKNDEDLKKAGKYFTDKGVKNVFITLGEDGVYYKTPKKEGFIVPPKIEMVNATGAGDAFVAGITYSMFKGKSLLEGLRFAMGASIMAITSEDTINPNMSPNKVRKILKTLEFETKEK